LGSIGLWRWCIAIRIIKMVNLVHRPDL
jgi:hypothetical protein